jgi:sugar phosphate isomerase/epimerase
VIQLGIFAKTFPVQGAAPVFQAARRAGYEAVQFNMACVGLPSMPDEIAPELAHAIRGTSKAEGVAIAALSATYNMVHPDANLREEGQRRLGVAIASAHGLGTRLVTLCTGTRDPHDQWRYHPDNSSAEAWRDLLASMEGAAALAEEHDVDLGIEPELANVVSSADHAQRLIRELQSPRLRIVLDPANLFEIEDDATRRTIISHAVDQLGERISMAHAKDRDARGGFAAAGRGVIDFHHFVSCLRSVGFDGPLVAHGLSEAEAPEVAAFLKGVVAS